MTQTALWTAVVVGDPGDGWQTALTVEGIIDTWSPGKARRYARLGYVHYHELRLVEDSSMGGTLHPRKVVWLRHTAVDSFLLDGGPHPPKPPLEMTPGIAYNFLPDWDQPYSPE